MRMPFVGLAGALFLALGANPVRSADLTWTNSVSSDWNNLTNWIPQQVPTASDHVIINSGSVTIPADGAFAIMDWMGGTIAGALTVATNGVLNISGSAEKDLFGALTNAGSVIWTDSGQLVVWYRPDLSYYGVVYNQPGGLFDMQTDARLYYSGGNEAFNNAGTLRKSAGSGITLFYPQLNNTGMVDVESGTLAFENGGGVGGQLSTASGAGINLASGNFVQAGSPLFGGGGQNQFTGSTLTLASDRIAGLALNGGILVLMPVFQGGSITNLTLSGSTLASTNTVSGVLNWTAGGIAGALTVATNGVLNISGSAEKDLFGALTNAGSVIWTDSGQLVVWYRPDLSYYGVVYNQPGGLFDMQTDARLYYSGGNEAFNNAGTLRKSAGSGITLFYPQLNNTGLVEADAGTLAIENNYTLADGELRFGLSSLTDYGKINFPGNAALAGTVGVAWLGGYVPATNNSFTVLSYGSFSALFTSLDLPAAALWATNYSATAFTVTVASINKLAFTTQPVSGKIPGVMLPPVVVQVEHPTGDPVAASGVPITLSLSSGSGALSGTRTQLTDATGKATFSDLSLDEIGIKMLLAAAPVLTPATSAPFRIVALIEGQRTSGGFMVQLNGNNSLGATIISASTNLLSWTPIYTNPPTTNIIQYLDTSSTNFPTRFYRAVEQ